MKKRQNIYLFVTIILCSAFVFLFQSCGDDDVEGCTDVNAENYNPDANVDNSTCIYARDKFIGEYVAEFNCPGTLEFISNDSLPVTIAPSLDPNNKSEIILTLEVSGTQVALRGSVSMDTLTIDDELKGVVIPHPQFGPINGDVKGTGKATLKNNDQTLDGTVNIQVTAQIFPIPVTDECTILGTRQ